MLDIIAIIAAVLTIAIAIVLILAWTKPATFSVRRSAVMLAPAEAIFPLINNFHQWANWSPWETKDPARLLQTVRRSQYGRVHFRA